MGMATIVGNTALGYLTSEAQSLLDQAKKYREMMNSLPEGDSRREVYKQAIQDLVERANRISSNVTTTITSTSGFHTKK